MDCELTASGSANCVEAPASVHLTFAPGGLSGLEWSTPPAGELVVEVRVDDAQVTKRTFVYRPPRDMEACSGDWGEDPRFKLD